ncbi:hypothetical protein PRIPAC_80599, partial [Pristionchus pacificus]|uniref:Uncharacterized protein n=1 Tax=Pristionchus pacificus TaxID=54126 RepID=A0A2A6BI15_PRIPA
MSEVASKQNVDQVEIQVAHVTAPDPVDILQRLSSHVRSLRIIQLPLRSSFRTNDFFFGMHNHKWATVFVDMLVSKLSNLHIDNTRYSGYLDHDCVKTIKQRLPRLGKELWFVASCSVLTHVVPKYKIEDHLVQIDCPNEKIGFDHESHSLCNFQKLVIKLVSFPA